MNSIQKISSQAILLLQILLIATPVVTLLPWIAKSALNGPYYGIFVFGKYVAYKDVAWATGSLTLGIFAQIVSIGPFMMALFVLRSVFKNYYQGEIFSTKNARHYRKLAWLFLLEASLIQSLSKQLLIIAVWISSSSSIVPPELFNAEPSNFKALSMSILFIMLANAIMLEGRQLQEEQNLTV